MVTITDQTIKYVNEHPDIKYCLKQGLINFSELARRIAKELDIEKEKPFEAIVIALRRYKERLEKDQENDIRIRQVLAKSEINIKNRIVVFILSKTIRPVTILEAENRVRKEQGLIYVLEGSESYIIITNEKYGQILDSKFRQYIIQKHRDLALISLITAKDIEKTRGVLAYLAGTFAENGVNIIEVLSCWTDTLFVIREQDLDKAVGFLKF
jgi:aspartokinase